MKPTIRYRVTIDKTETRYGLTKFEAEMEVKRIMAGLRSRIQISRDQG
jgi:hypothetical protein